MRHRTVRFRSSSQHSPDVLIGRLFLGRSPPRLLNAAAPGGLKPTPESRLREALSHLRYSSAGLPPTFVTHRDTDTCPGQFTLINIGLVDAIALVARFQKRSAALVQLGGVSLNPTPNATGVHFHAAFRQEFRDVLVRKRVAKVPPHAQDDHFSRVLTPFEWIAGRNRH